jgi:hypothetical protein
LNQILQNAGPLDKSVEYWKTRHNSRYWFLIEKTPFYWIGWFGDWWKRGKITRTPQSELEENLQLIEGLQQRFVGHFGKGT